MNWKSVQETCHHRTSTNSRPATSSSSCWTSCSHNILPGSHTASNTQWHYQQDRKRVLIPVVFEDAAFLSSCLHLWGLYKGIILVVLIMLSFALSISISYYLLLLQPSFPMEIIEVLSYLIYYTLIYRQFPLAQRQSTLYDPQSKAHSNTFILLLFTKGLG